MCLQMVMFTWESTATAGLKVTDNIVGLTETLIVACSKMG